MAEVPEDIMDHRGNPEDGNLVFGIVQLKN